MNITDLFTLPEHRLQHIVRLLFSDSEHIWQTVANRPLQVVSPGEWNTSDAGPDFRNMALLVDGRVLIGDGEFHRRSAEWQAHGHHLDPGYSNVVLHIVLEDDAGEPFAEHTLVLEPAVVLALLRAVPEPDAQTGGAADAEELQEYAYRRLLRKTAQALDLCRTMAPAQAFAELARLFLEQRAQKKSRPRGVRTLYNAAATTLEQTAPALLAGEVAAGQTEELYGRLGTLVRTAWIEAGKATRTELLVNALLPVLLAVAADADRTDILAWFWSQRSVHQYGALRKKFPGVGQEFVWKQQGLLEYAAMQKFGPDRVAESDLHGERRTVEARRRLALPGVTIRISLGRAIPR